MAELTPQSQPRPSPFRFLFLIPLLILLAFKVVLRKALLLIVLGVQGLLRYKVSSALVGILLIALLLSNLRGEPTAPVAASPAVAAAADGGLAPTPALQNYIKGQNTFDSRLMWAAMSERFQQNLMAQGGSPEAMQAQLDDARSQGRRFKDVRHLASFRLSDGRSIFLYLITMEAGGQSGEVPFLFTLSPDGKVDHVD